MMAEHQLLKIDDKQFISSSCWASILVLDQIWSICLWNPDCFIQDHHEKVPSSSYSSNVNYRGNVSYRQNWIIPCFCPSTAAVEELQTVDSSVGCDSNIPDMTCLWSPELCWIIIATIFSPSSHWYEDLIDINMDIYTLIKLFKKANCV